MPSTALTALMTVCFLTVAGPAGGQDQAVGLSTTVSNLLEDELLEPSQRRWLHIFHGQWDQLENPTPAEQAWIALYRYDLNHPLLQDEAAPAMARARAALLRGEAAEAAELLADDESAQAAVVRAEAFELMGKRNLAVELLDFWRGRLEQQQIEDGAELTAATEAMIRLARFEGRPADEYHLAVQLLAKVRQQIDRLYWPAHLTEAELLAEKDNASDAARALFDALRLNPRCSEAWYHLGLLAIDSFDFDRAEQAITQLHKINSEHLLADVLEVRMLLVQREVVGAEVIIAKALKINPDQRDMLSLAAAAKALRFDEAALEEAFNRFDEAGPGSPQAHMVVGRYLSLARQYDWGESVLREAIRRQPNHSEPRIELGLLLMQAGREEAAQRELRRAARLDPFNRRVSNQLQLVDALLNYDRIETEHFVIKYKKGIDAVLARDMALWVEPMYQQVTGAFEHRPARQTLIEIMPDEKWFGVRITGMPEIWTIAACTGDVISLTPPRSGAFQRGAYHWTNVLRHEFVHTVTLDQTSNRLPHWFTEACAVSQEITERDYRTCQLLAGALQAEKLFSLEDLTWAFVRPKKPTDRPLAYAQSDWMLEFVAARYGHKTIVAMLEMFRDGVSDAEAITKMTSQSPAAFFEAFKQWATEQVRQWGLHSQEPLDGLPTDPAGALNLSDARIAELLADHPRHVELLRIAALRALEGPDAEEARRAVLRYAAARPVDPFSYRQLVELAARTNRPEEMIAALEQLDRAESLHGRWAYQLAQLHRKAGRLDIAAAAAQRSLDHEPYNGTYRELAATLELQRKNPEHALHHLESMAILEPTKVIHQRRLAALYQKLGRHDESLQAAHKALELDPQADVERFLEESN